jgi:hypothetical protein
VANDVAVCNVVALVVYHSSPFIIPQISWIVPYKQLKSAGVTAFRWLLLRNQLELLSQNISYFEEYVKIKNLNILKLWVSLVNL